MHTLWKAFRNTCAGLLHAGSTERAVQQELILLAIAIPAAFAVGTTTWERIALVSTILLLLAVELLNTSIEKLCDHVTPHTHPVIKIVKDMGSAAVFCALCIAGLAWGAAILMRLGFL